MLRVGLTGGIAAGKSTASARFRELGATVIDYDVLAKEAVAPGSPGIAQVVAHFDNASLLACDGSLDRQKLADLIFHDPKKRAELEAIIHPIVYQLAADIETKAAAENPNAIVIHDIPLLVEAGLAPQFDLIIAVLTPAETRIRRLVETRGLSHMAARARIESAAPDYERAEIADLILEGAGTPENLKAQVEKTWHLLNTVG